MKFITPRGDVTFEIPDEWWEFAELPNFERVTEFYIPNDGDGVEIVALADIRPFKRVVGTGGFRKYKIMPVLFGLQSPETTLPPIHLTRSVGKDEYPFQLQNGFHRFYASIAVGYSLVPALIE